MAFFVNHTVACDKCGTEKTMKASSKQDMNIKLINPISGILTRWFADGNTHFCDNCRVEWPHTQDPNGDKI